MDFRFTAHDPQTGDFLHRLPRPEKVQIGDTFGTRGTLELTYSSKALNAKIMPTFVEIRQEATFDGGMTWAPIGPNYLRLSGSHEDTDQAGMREVKFVSREWLLSKARVGAGDLPLIDNKRPFYRSSPGAIMRTLLLEAGDRGAAQGIEIGGFTGSRDSSGNSWPKVATIYYQPGLPILSVLENLVEQGLCDYRMDGNTMRLYAPETTMGRDLTTRADPVRVHGHVTEAPVNYTLEDLTTSALLIGDSGFEVEVDNPSAPDNYGRLEATIEQGGVSDEGTARVMIDETLQKGSREIREITRTQRADGLKFLPYRDYRVGDFVQVRDQGAWERYRVREIQAVRDDKGWTVHTVINDRLQELLLKLAKRTSGIVNGSTGSGGDGTPPTPPMKPGIEPAAPEGLLVDQQVYLDRQGIARGQITAGWSAVTQSTKGQAVEIGGYELWTRRNETHASWVRAASTDGDLTATHSPVVLSDADGNALEYQWRVRAIAQASNRPGPWSDTVTLTMTQDTEPPNVPSLPTVETDLRIITVDWDGLDESAEAMPVDFNHLRIYFAAAEDMAGAERVGSLTQRGTWTSGSMPADVPVWVAVSAVDNVGNESAMTPAQSVAPQKLVDDDSIRDAVEGIDGKIDQAVSDLNDAIDNIVIDANGTTTYWMPTAPDATTDPAPKTGDLWFDTSEEGKNELHRFDGQEWVSAADERIDTISQAQDDLEADVDRVRTSVDGKNAITQSTSTPPHQYDGAVGDIWEIMSSMGSGGRSVSRWRWNGTVWVSNLIGDTVLGNVDAAKIGTGYLSADRVKAGSLTADKVLIGTGTDLIGDGGFLADIGESWRVASGTAESWSIARPQDGTNYLVGRQVGTGWKSIASYPGVRVTPGQEYLVAADFRVASAWPTGYPRIEVYVYDGDGVRIQAGSVANASGTDTSWISVAGTVTVPDGGVSMTFVAVIHSTTTDGSEVNVRNPTFRLVNGSTLIEDGAITTAKIAVGAITAESGVVGSLDAGDISVGELDAARIGANTITSGKLLIGGPDNMVDDPEFLAELGTSWLAYTGSLSQWVRSSSPGELVGTATGGWVEIVQSERAKVTPGETLAVQCDIRYESAWATGNANLSVFFFDSSGTRVSSPTIRTADTASTSWATYVGTVDVPGDAATATIALSLASGSPAGANARFRKPRMRKQIGATLIEDGAITTDKILANAITAGKIAALAIEADHISANAITADKIKAGAIDGKLITGARIRTAASGRRTELDVEGLRSYDSSGNTVLTTQTSDGSIEMKGDLRQTSKGITFEVGKNYQDGGPGIQWSDSNYYAYPPGVVYSNDRDEGNKKRTLVQGPGSTGGNSFINLYETGDLFDIRTWKSSPSTGDDWRIRADLGNNIMRIGSSTSNAPYMYFRRGTGDTGAAWMGYNHPSNGGYASLSLRDRRIWLGTYDSSGNLVSRLWGDAESTELTAGSRPISIKGENYTVLFGGRDSSGTWTQMPGVANRSMSGYSKVIVSPNGTIGAEGSSRRFKVNIESVDAGDYEDALLSITPKTWQDRIESTQHEEYLEWREKTPEGPAPQSLANSPQDEPRRYFGAIAEDFEDAGLSQFVGYDDYGRPNALAYDRIGPALIPIIRRLRDRVDVLEQQLGETA